MTSTDPQSAREKWNRRYSEEGWEPFPDRPSEWLVENRELVIAPGAVRAPPAPRALDVACGDGRNSRYLAQRGFAVDAVDVSDVAIAALRAAAVEHDLAVDPRRMDLEAEALPVARYDIIVHMNYLQRDLFAALEQALVPGGMLVLETVSPAHVEELGKSFDPRFVLDDNELLRSFPGLRVRHYREGVVERAGRPRGVASLVAERRVA